MKKVGFNPKKDIHFMPCSGLTGANLKEPSDFCPWYMYVEFLYYSTLLYKSKLICSIGGRGHGRASRREIRINLSHSSFPGLLMALRH